MENKQLTLGSLFDGSGGFPLGGLLTGQITPLWSRLPSGSRPSACRG